MSEQGIRKPVVREVTLNGVTMDIVTRAGIDYYALKQKDLIPIGGGKYIHGYLNRDDLYRAAGYDLNKIDFSVPQEWFMQPENRARYQKGDRAVWSYAGYKNRIFGKPIWDSEMKARMKRKLTQRLSK